MQYPRRETAGELGKSPCVAFRAHQRLFRWHQRNVDSKEQILFYNYFTLSQFLFHTGSRGLTIISPTHSTAFFLLPSDSACLPLPEPLQWPPCDHTLRSLSLSLLTQPQSQRKLSEPRNPIQSPLFPGENPAGWPVTNRYGPHSSTRHSQPSPGNTAADFLPVQCPLEPLPGTPAPPSPRPSLLLSPTLPPAHHRFSFTSLPSLCGRRLYTSSLHWS